MASSFKVNPLDPRHAKVIKDLQRRFGTSTISRALSRFLDQYPKERDQAEQDAAHVARLLVLLEDREEALRDREGIERELSKAERELTAYAKGLRGAQK